MSKLNDLSGRLKTVAAGLRTAAPAKSSLKTHVTNVEGLIGDARKKLQEARSAIEKAVKDPEVGVDAIEAKRIADSINNELVKAQNDAQRLITVVSEGAAPTTKKK
jgi:predicted homoserine dehydrogenase-like protein